MITALVLLAASAIIALATAQRAIALANDAATDHLEALGALVALQAEQDEWTEQAARALAQRTCLQLDHLENHPTCQECST